MATSLHTSLKQYYAQPGDKLEVPVEGYLIDIVHGSELIEIQTANFTAIKSKIYHLIDNYPIRVVYPIAYDKWIVRKTVDGQTISRRRSPKHGRFEYLFNELVRIPKIINHPNFTLTVMRTIEEEIQSNDGRGSWRRAGRSIVDRRLIDIIDQVTFVKSSDFISLLPKALPLPFTSSDLSSIGRLSLSLSYKMIYCLKQLELIEVVGKQSRSNLYMLSVGVGKIDSDYER
jgi:hypothetical protein